MNRYPYYFNASVEEALCFPNLLLKPSGALIYIQRAATKHLDNMGFDYQLLYDLGVVFMLANSATRFYENPVADHKIIVATCPAVSKGAQLIRETVIMDENQQVLVENHTAWVMLSPNTGKILRPNQIPVKLPMLESYKPFCDVSKIKIPTGGEVLGVRKVVLNDLDRNMHMNNTVYASILTDCFPYEVLNGTIKDMFIKYKHQSRLGEELTIIGEKSPEGFFINASQNDQLYFSGMFTLK